MSRSSALHLNEIGDSLVVVEMMISSGTRSHRPAEQGARGGLKFGPLLTVKIESMREQHTAKVIEGTADAPKERVIVPAEKKFGFAAVLPARASSIRSPTSAQTLWYRGRSDHEPVTDDILHAVDAVPAEIVFVLPNNKNIIMAAEQAVHLSEEKR